MPQVASSDRPTETTGSLEDLRFVWLEITGACQLECYAESGPAGTHGTMRSADRYRVIDQCAEMGVYMVQFIGGEQTGIRTWHVGAPCSEDRARG